MVTPIHSFGSFDSVSAFDINELLMSCQTVGVSHTNSRILIVLITICLIFKCFFDNKGTQTWITLKHFSISFYWWSSSRHVSSKQYEIFDWSNWRWNTYEIFAGTAMECYVCSNQTENSEKCLNTIKTCEPGEDVCLTEIRWGSHPYFTLGALKQYYVSKRCSTKSLCSKIRRKYMPYCTHIWYEDWTCSECCQGDRCNYYVIVSHEFWWKSIIFVCIFQFILPHVELGLIEYLFTISTEWSRAFSTRLLADWSRAFFILSFIAHLAHWKHDDMRHAYSITYHTFSLIKRIEILKTTGPSRNKPSKSSF